MTLSLGTRLGPYEIVAPLGAGGMGEVWKACDTRLGREVALKVLPGDFLESEERKVRFEREARTLAALNHPGIAAIYAFEEIPGSPGSPRRHLLAMELLEGASLRETLRTGPLPPRKAIQYGVEIAEGLAAAHEKGIVHRDLKPENLFVTKDGRIKILDFGLAKRTGQEKTGDKTSAPTASKHTQAGVVLGTVGYMSPEQVRGEAVDARSDLFALGLLIYEMLTGCQAFQGDTAADILAAILKEDPPGLEALARKASPALMALTKRCLEKRRENRFSSAEDVAIALRAVAHSSSPGYEPGFARKSIVVLPFENLSPDPDNAFFADGLTEEIIADLSKIRALLVISRTSAMHYKGMAKPLPAIAQELNVRHVLEGSVRRAGTTLRITAQLIDAATDAPLWAEKYTGTLDDVFAMQEQVSRAIVAALQVTLAPEESRQLAEPPIPNVVAYEYFLRARAETYRWSEGGVARSLELLERALEAAGDNPLLLASQATAYWQRFNLRPSADRTPLRLATSLAERALKMDPGCSMAWVALALPAMFEPPGLTRMLDPLRRAVVLDPSNIDALGWLGACCTCLGREEEAGRALEQATRQDPLSLVWTFWRACLDVYAGRSATAEARLERWKGELYENSYIASVYCVFILAPARRLDEMEPLVAHWARVLTGEPLFQHLVFLYHATKGDRAAAEAALTPQLLDLARHGAGHFAQIIAQGFAAMGDAERALALLTRAVDLGFHHYAFLAKHDPLLASLRPDPRFQALLVRVRQERANQGDES